MGWLRSSPKPRLRTSRSIAMRDRQAAQEAIAEAQEKVGKDLKRAIAEVAAAQQEINRRRAGLAQLKKDLAAEAEMLARMKDAILDQEELEERIRRNRSRGSDLSVLS